MNKVQPNANDAVCWHDGPSIRGRQDSFVLQEVSSEKVLKSWKYSLFAHEWLDGDGKILKIDDMMDREQKKRLDVLKRLKNREPLEYAVLGLGLTDHIEIGAGRAIFLTLVAEGYRALPVYIPKSCLKEFKNYLS